MYYFGEENLFLSLFMFHLQFHILECKKEIVLVFVSQNSLLPLLNIYLISTFNKIKSRVTKWPRNFLPGMCPKELKAESQRDICTARMIAAFFTITKTWKQSKWPRTSQWTNKIWHHAMIFSLKQEGNSEISQSQKDKDGMIPLIWDT